MNLEIFNIANLLIKVTIIFAVLLLLARILGKKQMSHLTFFNYVTGITIGSVAANAITQSNNFAVQELIGVIWWCILTELTGFVNLKSGNLRRIIDGEPIILIKRGKIIKRALRLSRINMDDLSMMLRSKEVFSISEIEYAILEPDGKLSIMKKVEQQQPTKLDMKISIPKLDYMPSEIIVDGKVIKRNLLELNLDEEWLNHQLKKMNVESVKQVFYAEIQSDGTLFVDKN